MSIGIPSRVVVFDYGEVISIEPSPADRDALLAVAGIRSAGPDDAGPVDAERVALFWERYWAHRHELDRGTLGTDAYWRRIAGEIGADWDLPTRQRLWAADFRSWISVEPGTLRLIEELRDGGTRVALLSNAGEDFAGAFRFSPMGSLFELVVVSGEQRMIKPDPEIYLATARALGIRPDEMVFVDNRQDNVDGAASVGVTAHRFTGVAELRAFLEGLAAASADPAS